MATSQSVAQKIHNLSAQMARQSDQILRERLGLGLSQYKILSAVEHNARLQQRHIAVDLGQTEASVSRQIKLLLKQGLIVSSPNPANRREHFTRLTVKGEQVTEAARQSLASYQRGITAHLSPRQQEILLELLTDLQA